MINFQYIKKAPYLYTELAEKFYTRGYKVYIAAILEGKYVNKIKLKKEFGLNILRIHTGEMINVNMIRKGIITILIPFLLKKHLKDIFGVSSLT